MQDLNFLFKQTRTGNGLSSTDNTFGYPEDAICVVSSSTEGNYVKFNNKVFNHFGINPEQDNYIVFGVNPTNKEVTFVIVDESQLDNYPKTNTNKIQKGAGNKGFIRISSKPAVLTLVDATEVQDGEDTNLVWDTATFNVELSQTENGTNYLTVGSQITSDGDETPADIFEEVNDLPFFVQA